MEIKNQKLVFIAMLLGIMLLLSGCQDTGSIGEYQSTPQLYASCPGECDEKLACEGEKVKVWGYLDAHNVFAPAQSPQEAERFLIAEKLDDQGFAKGKRIEVTPPQGENNAALFEKLEGAGSSSKILLTGIVSGYDAPTNLTCQRLIRLEIQGEEDLDIE
ncbi:MAG: hypothetical protein ACWGOY_05615 [Anaerolineales bacterium]